MIYRRLGRTNFEVSSVGFGTNQLRLLPEETAVSVLLEGFKNGVNFVHVSTDYEGAESIVAQAMRRHRGTIYPAINSYDLHGSEGTPAEGFRQNFERSCEIFKTNTLPLYGVAAVEDRVALRENVWGENGIIEFLQQMKKQGRVDHLFCTTHGNPEFIKSLIDADVFDAIMLSYTPLGYHLLTLHPPGQRGFENIARNRLDIFPMCRERDIGVMVMMPLAGGLLVGEQGFPGTRDRSEPDTISAGTVLRSILQDDDVASVMPGVTSIEEARENALAGDLTPELDPAEAAAFDARMTNVRASVCSRCGACEPLCSQRLPISWLFRAGEMAEHPAEHFETWKEVDYFGLHPDQTATCDTCTDVSCACPYGLDIPQQLSQTHSRMLELMAAVKVPPPPGDLRAHRGTDAFGAQIIRLDVSDNTSRTTRRSARSSLWRLQLENTGDIPWGPDLPVTLVVSSGGASITEVKPRQVAHRGTRVFFSFEHRHGKADHDPSLELNLKSGDPSVDSVTLFHGRASELNTLHATSETENMFFLKKKDPPYSVDWVEHNLPTRWPEGSRMQFYVEIRNTGSRPWLRDAASAEATGGKTGPVNLTVSLDGERVANTQLPHDILPGQSGIVGALVDMPDGMGDWKIEVSLVEQGIAWFHERGVKPVVANIARTRRDGMRDQQTIASMLQLNPAFYIPGEGIPTARDGRPFPGAMAHAKGALIRDSEGNEWIDYAMGWGSALLGHAHPDVTSAVADVLTSGAISSLPHQLEAQVSEELQKFIPSCEMVLFGKNGSDACSAAVRVARVFTGKRKILFSGFHGWKDPFAPAFEAALADSQTGDVVRFQLNDLNGLAGLIKQHRDDIAAMIIEPAAQVEGVDGPVRNVDPEFLAEAVSMTREAGALVIFDEIFTGFRYDKGSVQASKNIVPDLTCLGKGLASGMPLSALVGKRRVMAPTLSKIFYHPTFKSEVYSFAAAKAALDIYWNTDVPGEIHKFGTRLRQQVNQLAKDANIDGALIGLPFRMVFRFGDSDPHRNQLKRTLLQQELLLRGVMTFRGFMLPSLAHGDDEMEKTLEAFRQSFERVNDVSDRNQFTSNLELPLLI